MKLRPNQCCPIHPSRFCCDREQVRKERRVSLGIQRIEDPHHQCGYRELRSPAEMRKLLDRTLSNRMASALICHEHFTDYNDVVQEHIELKGMGRCLAG